MSREPSLEIASPRRQSHPIDAPSQFHFINVNPGSTHSGRRSNQLAHAHLARFNRRGRRGNAVKSDVLSTRRQTAPAAVSTVSSRGLSPSGEETGGLPRPPDYLHGITLSNPTIDLSGSESGRLSQADFPHVSSRSNTAVGELQEETGEDAFEDYLRMSTREPPVRTLSPVLGAIPNSTFEYASPSILAQTLDTKLNLTFPKYQKPFDISSRLKLFYEKPIVFHGFTVASAVHRDVLRNEACLSRNPEIIAHHGKLLHLLNDLLSNLADADIELAILAILLLTIADLDWDKLEGDPVIPFRPHMASANWINVFGRVMSVDECRFAEHVRAMATLVARRGSLHDLRLPSLGVQVAYQDLIGASRAISKPLFPCVWKLSDEVVAACRQLQTPTAGEEVPGNGFRFLEQAGLPAKMVGCFILVSCIDTLLAGCRTPSNVDSSALVNARNTVQHRVLSLTAYDSLDERLRRAVSPVMYEFSRLTAILYCTAVVFGMPPQTNWHLRLVGRIRQLLECPSRQDWNRDLSSLLLWILVVAGIAAYRSPEREFFETALRDMLEEHGISSWSAVEQRTSQFLWSDVACSHGAAVLWDAVQARLR